MKDIQLYLQLNPSCVHHLNVYIYFHFYPKKYSINWLVAVQVHQCLWSYPILNDVQQPVK